jgi:diaminohydroxyphosphoribosylaminopyrimidine deaminase/5-amino-6-(5-phosphoribosylamino)uracil reductase
MNSKKFMQLAIDKAWKYQFLTYPNPAVGATVVKDGKILSVEAHKKAGMPHAEVLALKVAYLTQYKDSPLQKLETSLEIHNYLIENHKDFFKDCEIYVTLEPCNHIGKTPACAMLLETIQIKKVYIGTLDCNDKATGGLQRLQNANIEVEIDICKNEADKLLYPFKKWQQDSFVFFKLAMREDRTIDGGYITTKDSLTLVHKINSKGR